MVNLGALCSWAWIIFSTHSQSNDLEVKTSFNCNISFVLMFDYFNVHSYKICMQNERVCFFKLVWILQHLPSTCIASRIDLKKSNFTFFFIHKLYVIFGIMPVVYIFKVLQIKIFVNVSKVILQDFNRIKFLIPQVVRQLWSVLRVRPDDTCQWIRHEVRRTITTATWRTITRISPEMLCL